MSLVEYLMRDGNDITMEMDATLVIVDEYTLIAGVENSNQDHHLFAEYVETIQ